MNDARVQDGNLARWFWLALGLGLLFKLVLAAVAYLSYFAATVPGERLDEEVLPLVAAEDPDTDQVAADGPGRGGRRWGRRTPGGGQGR